MSEFTNFLKLDASDMAKSVENLQNKQLRPFNKTAKEINENLNQMADRLNNLTVIYQATATTGQKLNAIMVKQDGVFKLVKESTVVLKDAQTQLEEQYVATAKASKIFASAVQQASREIRAEEKATDSLVKTFERQIEAATRAAKAELKLAGIRATANRATPQEAHVQAFRDASVRAIVPDQDAQVQAFRKAQIAALGSGQQVNAQVEA